MYSVFALSALPRFLIYAVRYPLSAATYLNAVPVALPSTSLPLSDEEIYPTKSSPSIVTSLALYVASKRVVRPSKSSVPAGFALSLSFAFQNEELDTTVTEKPLLMLYAPEEMLAVRVTV